MIDVVNGDPMAPCALPTLTPTTGSSGRRSCARRPTSTSARCAASNGSRSCVAENDVLTPTKIAIDGFQTACDPKQLVVLPGGHFDAYVKGFEISACTQADWFTQHLLAGAAARASHP